MLRDEAGRCYCSLLFPLSAFLSLSLSLSLTHPPTHPPTQYLLFSLIRSLTLSLFLSVCAPPTFLRVTRSRAESPACGTRPSERAAPLESRVHVASVGLPHWGEEERRDVTALRP